MKFYIALFFSIITIAATAQDYTIENNEIKLVAASIQFENDTAELLTQSNTALSMIKKYLEDKSYITMLRIEGHTNTDNQQLSENRAAIIVKKLVDMGIDCKGLLPWDFLIQNLLRIMILQKEKLPTKEYPLLMQP
ncbi:MAG: OmpA family protein [Chitinophagaceae bacterium]|nr:OmpA family protein [Chitinophagaceae bacterium]